MARSGVALRGGRADGAGALALSGACRLAGLSGNIETARRYGDVAIEVARAIDDPPTLVLALIARGSVSLETLSSEEAAPFYEEAAALAREAGDDRVLGAALGNLGVLAACSGDWNGAHAYFSESLALRSSSKFALIAKANLALSDLQLGQKPSGVAERYEDVLRLASEQGGSSSAPRESRPLGPRSRMTLWGNVPPVAQASRVRFEKLLNAMRSRDAHTQEEAFFELDAHAGDFVSELLAAFEIERARDHGLACWLLELLGASKSPQAAPLFESLLTDGDADSAYRDWATRGLKEIDTKASRTVLFHHSQRRSGDETFT